MKTITLSLIVLAGAAFAQPAAKPETPAASATATLTAPVKQFPIGTEAELKLELLDKNVQDVNAKIAVATKAIDDLRSKLMEPLQGQLNTLMGDICKSHGLAVTECGYDPQTKSVHKVEPAKQAAKP